MQKTEQDDLIERPNHPSKDELLREFKALSEELVLLKRMTLELREDVAEDLLDLCEEVLYDLVYENTSVKQFRENVQEYSRQYSNRIASVLFRSLRSKAISEHPLLDGYVATEIRGVC